MGLSPIQRTGQNMSPVSFFQLYWSMSNLMVDPSRADVKQSCSRPHELTDSTFFKILYEPVRARVWLGRWGKCAEMSPSAGCLNILHPSIHPIAYPDTISCSVTHKYLDENASFGSHTPIFLCLSE